VRVSISSRHQYPSSPENVCCTHLLSSHTSLVLRCANYSCLLLFSVEEPCLGGRVRQCEEQKDTETHGDSAVDQKYILFRISMSLYSSACRAVPSRWPVELTSCQWRNSKYHQISTSSVREALQYEGTATHSCKCVVPEGGSQWLFFSGIPYRVDDHQTRQYTSFQNS